MRFSVSLLPEFTPQRAAEIAKAAEADGFHGFFIGDEVYHREAWMTLAACALNTKTIRLGPGLTHVVLREPSFVAQAIGTLEQMAPKRTFCGISVGNNEMIEQHGHFSKELRPNSLERLREAITVIRQLIRTGRCDFHGEFLNYSGVTTSATSKNTIPILVGGMGGPRSFRLAGEIGDGVLSAFGCSKSYHDYVLENVELGARAGISGQRRLKRFPYIAWNFVCVSKKSQVAREAARWFVAFYMASIPKVQLELHGVSTETVRPICEDLKRGDLGSAVRQTNDDLVNTFSISGSIDDCVEKIVKDFESSKVDELAGCFVEPEILASMFGKRITGLIGYPENFKLFKKEVISRSSSAKELS